MPTTSTVLSPSHRLRELEKKRFHAERKGRIPIMDAETLRELCRENDGYETPELNDNLYAHFQGFQRIEGLDAYFNLKALWLESNGLTKIENLAPLVSLRCLYLSKNLIERIENLESLQELNTLDLSDNRVRTLSGLAQLSQLSSLNLSRNQLETYDDLQELTQCKQLTNIDVSHNRLEDPRVLEIFQAIPQLRALRITGNAVVSKTKYFRKLYIASLPQLSFLDRPIFPMERAGVAAWQQGGNDAELEAKRAFVNSEHDERRRTLQEFRDWQAQVRAKRLKELDDERLQKQLHDKENASQNPEAVFEGECDDGVSLDEIDLKGFRGITKEQYARLKPHERAKWDDRIAQAHAAAVKETHEVLGDGIQKIGATFWAANARKQSEDAAPSPAVTTVDPPPPLLDTEELHDVSEPLIEAQDAATAVLRHDLLDDGDLQMVEAATTGLSALHVTPSPAGLAECGNQKTESRVPTDKAAGPGLHVTDDNAQRERLIAACEMPPPAPVSSFGGSTGDVRETWAQLEQRARASSFRHRPQHLPSVHSSMHEDEDDEDISAAAAQGVVASSSPSSARTIRALTRAEILHELRAEHRQHAPPLSVIDVDTLKVVPSPASASLGHVCTHDDRTNGKDTVSCTNVQSLD
uniref:Dynein assembly factor 1, axonemal homolog n=1 Tax=Globisporangium ultimum (strain ATCC 200006 / CBS 805.95 / DAOM BR144) TaxID=431595 RepID=K3WYY9_GLOUD